jgi:hypothetical protein
MMTNDRDSMARDGEALARVRVLLQNYPRLSQTESDEVAHFLKKGAPIDIGLLASDRSIWETAQVFKAANPHYFKLSYKVYAAWVVAITLIVGSLALLKDFAVE